MKCHVNIEREKRGSDGKGHKVDAGAPTVIATSVTADLEYHTTNKLTLLEQGPGLSLREFRLLIIRKKPWPAVLSNDIVTVIGEKAYTVMFVRKYQAEMQIDMQEQG